MGRTRCEGPPMPRQVHLAACMLIAGEPCDCCPMQCMLIRNCQMQVPAYD